MVFLVFGALLAGVATFGAKTREADDDVTLVRTEKLANAPGQTLTAVTVNYAPGGKSRGHHHAGAVFAYVLSGAIRSENSATGPVKVYKAGESFFEPPGSKHLISENASATEPASLLAVFIADDGAQLTTFDSARSAPPADKDPELTRFGGRFTAHAQLAKALGRVPIAVEAMTTHARPESFTPAMDISAMTQHCLHSRLFRS
jgi:quercetin dioxygenase-like cupin family protein